MLLLLLSTAVKLSQWSRGVYSMRRLSSGGGWFGVAPVGIVKHHCARLIVASAFRSVQHSDLRTFSQPHTRTHARTKKGGRRKKTKRKAKSEHDHCVFCKVDRSQSLDREPIQKPRARQGKGYSLTGIDYVWYRYLLEYSSR